MSAKLLRFLLSPNSPTSTSRCDPSPHVVISLMLRRGLSRRVGVVTSITGVPHLGDWNRTGIPVGGRISAGSAGGQRLRDKAQHVCYRLAGLHATCLARRWGYLRSGPLLAPLLCKERSSEHGVRHPTPYFGLKCSDVGSAQVVRLAQEELHDSKSGELLGGTASALFFSDLRGI